MKQTIYILMLIGLFIFFPHSARCIVPPDGGEPGVLKAISIEGPTTVQENGAAQYTAEALFTDLTMEDITGAASWSVSPGTYASINGSGYLTATSVSANQTVTITAAYGGMSKSKTVTILNRVVTSVSVRVPYGWIDENSERDAIATAYFNFGSSQDVTYNSTYSDNSSYAYFIGNTMKCLSVPSQQFVLITATYNGVTSSPFGVTIRDVVYTK